MRPLRPLLPFVLSLAACSTAPPAPLPVAVAPPPVAATPSFMGYANLVLPERLADGGYATPNRLAAPDAALWHLRAGLNVAALSCRADEAALVAGYNALLSAHPAEFAAAHRFATASYGGAAAFDAAMTRLYNYYALPPAQPGLCAAARAVLADAALVPAGGLSGFAPAALARLDAPYLAVFARQDAWLATRRPVALAAVVPPHVTVDASIFAATDR